jgi:RNA polymerase sigma factor (sigma-70 family)
MSEANPSKHVTSHTLLDRINLGDDDAWYDFFQRYRAYVAEVVRNWYGKKLSDIEIDEVIQRTMLGVMKQGSRYDKKKAKFRTYLKGIIHHKASRRLSREAKGREPYAGA